MKAPCKVSRSVNGRRRRKGGAVFVSTAITGRSYAASVTAAAGFFALWQWGRYLSCRWRLNQNKQRREQWKQKQRRKMRWQRGIHGNVLCWKSKLSNASKERKKKLADSMFWYSRKPSYCFVLPQCLCCNLSCGFEENISAINCRNMFFFCCGYISSNCWPVFSLHAFVIYYFYFEVLSF